MKCSLPYRVGGALGGRTPMSAISEKYESLGASASFLGEPTGPELPCPDSIGKHRHYKGGSIHWSPKSGAHSTRGLSRKKWEAMNWEVGPLGYPISDERPCNGGRITEFQGGFVLWKTFTKDAFEVHGSIKDKWVTLGRENSFLGLPETDESTCPDGRGKFNHFEKGSIYWTPETGAHEVHGLIRQRWAKLGWERSSLGYPISDEKDMPGGRVSHFQGGRIEWTKQKGAREIVEPFKHRRILIDGTIKVKDDEDSGPFPAEHEMEDIVVNLSVFIDRPRVAFPRVRISEETGGEIITRIHLDGEGLPGGMVRLSGFAELDENDEVPEREEFSSIVLVPGTSSEIIVMLNTDAADQAMGSMRVTNLDA